MRDDLGDRMKSYEREATGITLVDGNPIYARIDGRAFSNFTRGMARPYDLRMSRAMIETTKVMVEQLHARIGYTQSDEISLCWLFDDPKSEIIFGGRVQKFASILAGLATAAFTQALQEQAVTRQDRIVIEDRIRHKLPHFDARVFNLPDLDECANAFIWREQDARRNAISMAARHHFSHRALQGKSSVTMLQMLQSEGVVFEDYPIFFRKGTYVRRETIERPMTPEELGPIPEKHRPAPDQIITRSITKVLDIPSMAQLANRVGVIFMGQEPTIWSEQHDI